jgi:hypothetical protein
MFDASNGLPDVATPNPPGGIGAYRGISATLTAVRGDLGAVCFDRTGRGNP